MQYYYHKLVLAYVHVSIFVIIIDRRQVESHTLHPTEGMRRITLEIMTQFIIRVMCALGTCSCTWYFNLNTKGQCGKVLKESHG